MTDNILSYFTCFHLVYAVTPQLATTTTKKTINSLIIQYYEFIIISQMNTIPDVSIGWTNSGLFTSNQKSSSARKLSKLI